jgi:GNAT superfamily N-acetyltransferase
MAYTADRRPRIERLERDAVDAAMARITTVARVMDALFVIPGTGIRLGFDAILGLVPVLGDLLSQAIATYIIWEARQLGVEADLGAWSATRPRYRRAGRPPATFSTSLRANMKNPRPRRRPASAQHAAVCAYVHYRGRSIAVAWRLTTAATLSVWPAPP